MARGRRVISHGGYNYVSVAAGKLVLSAEKRTVLVFDSLHPVEAVELDLHQAINILPDEGSNSQLCSVCKS
mgnify:FL=1